MSSSSVCQGLQSCIEPRVIEPRVLRLKLTPPGSNLSSGANNTSASAPPSPVKEKTLPVNNDTKSNEEEGHGFGFLQALSNNSHCDEKEKENKNEEVYVHPTVKRSASMLSEKSLEMCTESLGSETGSNAGESIDDISLFETKHDDDVVVIEGSNTNWGVSRRANNNNRASNFPPPLTSITDFGGVHVRPHREGGRLILEAVASPSPTPYFHAERGDGRLILRLLKGVFNSEVEEEEEVEEEVSEEEEDEFEESVENVEDEMDVKKFARPSRCKENGNRDIFFGDGYFELSLCL